MTEFLRQVDLFSDLSEKYLKQLEKVAKERVFKAGDHIVRQGEPGEGLFIITDGKVEIQKTMSNGKIMSIATHGPGDFFGEMAILDGAARSADVVALEDSKCLVIVSWDFTSLMKNHPEIALEILPMVVRRFRETNAKLLSLAQA